MNLNRANEKPLEAHGASAQTPGSVKDWQADRLAAAMSKLEELFTQAIAAQERHGPVDGDVPLRVKATMGDLRQVAAQDAQSMRTIGTHAENFVVAAEQGQVAKYFAEGTDNKTAVATLALAANAEFAKSTFYGVTQDACSADVKLDRMCQRAHALVKAGYIGEKELAGVQVAITENTSSNAKAADAFHTLAKSTVPPAMTPLVQEQGSTVDQLSMFKDDLSKVLPVAPNVPSITVNADQSRQLGSHRPEAAVDMFSHELGHWLARDKAPAMLAAGVEAVKAQGGPDAALADKFFPEKDLEPARLTMLASQDGGLMGQEMRSMTVLGHEMPVSWLATAKEMQGDLMAVAAENAEFGRDAALAQARTLVDARDKERLGDLARQTAELNAGEMKPGEVRFTEEHYTSAAVRDFADKVRAGELDKVHTPEQLDRLMGESVVKGLMEQYAQARGAELNVHHLENGRVVPGTPPGVELKDVLVAEMAQNLRNVAGHPTVLLTAEQAQRLAPDAKVAKLEMPGQQADGQPVRYLLSTKAPEGVALPEVAKGTVKVGEFEVASSMAPFARDVAQRSEAARDTPAPGRTNDVDARGPGDGTVKVAELGSQAQQGSVQAAEQKLEAAQSKTAEMVM